MTSDIETSHRQAKTKAEDKNVGIFGGANIAQQYLQSGLIDEISIGITPTLLGSGKRLFDNIGKHIEPFQLIHNLLDNEIIPHQS